MFKKYVINTERVQVNHKEPGMLQNQEDLKSKVRCLTYKFAAVGWVASALTMGLIVSTAGAPSFSSVLKHGAFIAAYMAAVTLVPLILSTFLASKWISGLAADEELTIPSAIKYFYASLITILIAVGGAGLFTVFGAGLYSFAYDLFMNHLARNSSNEFGDALIMMVAGFGYPVMMGLWIEIPMVFIYSYKIRKLIQAHRVDAQVLP
jgi:hypothetical protein